MGLFNNIFQPQQTTPTISSILPNVAKQEILSGRLPNINADKIVLKAGELCHYADKALYEKKHVHKHYVRRNSGVSMPGIFKGNRVHFGGGDTTVNEDVTYETIKGYLFVTNKRLVFVGETEGFDEKLSDIVAITPYANCVIVQMKNKEYRLFVPDGNVINTVIRLIV